MFSGGEGGNFSLDGGFPPPHMNFVRELDKYLFNNARLNLMQILLGESKEGEVE